MSDAASVHPYVPNSVPRIKREMLDAIGVRDVALFSAHGGNSEDGRLTLV